MWGFQTDPEYQKLLDWAEEFVRTEVEPVDRLVRQPYDLADPVRAALIPPLQEKARAQGLWACHLGPELGGPGYGQLKLALLNEILGRSRCAPTVFGCQAPDSGNSEILAHFGTEEHKAKYLEPLLRNEIVSCFSMTEPQGGADPKVFKTRAVLDGDEWVINGEKWFSSNARFASFLIVVAVTDPDAPPYRQQSMFIVPTDTPGIRFIRHVELIDEEVGGGTEGYISYENVRVPRANLLGEQGGGFAVAQVRLGGGRIHHAMRTVGLVKWAFDMMCERALSRFTQGEVLARKQLVQEAIADTWIQIEQFRLLVLRTAWLIDERQDYRQVRGDIAAIKAVMPKVMLDVTSRALQLHGSLGLTKEMPFFDMLVAGYTVGLADGPTEVHKVTLAREVLKQHKATDGLFPTSHLVALEEQARRRYADVLADL
ncbi:acyl-CoA dehydrogenase family protein [Frankia sp. Cppng1_Ct_nod]|uniref:acyl-CoA dehydrogenase family protein n=1 Tax=Frankia sp. Cppng1_Ct_nod TaxID=2897162 RepID=UPI001041585A|nr:acyl-CoA dehydrogenase family protein [Frankia sp. Cppng1_Ct_nod]